MEVRHQQPNIKLTLTFLPFSGVPERPVRRIAKSREHGGWTAV